MTAHHPALTTGARAAGRRLRRAGAAVRRYVRELTGEAAYDRYAERMRAEGHEPLSRREFERRTDRREAASREGFRCC